MKQSKKIFLSLLFLLLLNYFSFSQDVSDITSLLSSEGKVLYGNEPNSILVIDYPENLKRIEEYLKMIDVPPRQVVIEARVVEVKLQGEHSLGINWQLFAEKHGLEMGQFRIGSSEGGPLEQMIPYKSTYYPPGSTQSEDMEEPFTVTVFDENINVVLKALANSLKTNILSAPRVTTVNNRPAEIKIVKKLPWAEPEVEMTEQGITVTWKINFEEVGIVLKVTPTITEDGRIAMELKPEVSEHVGDYKLTVIQGTTQIPYTVPIIDTRSADTKVVIGNGQTLIIGGLIKEKNTQGETKVPLLGDIPGLGWLFKSRKKTKDKTELLIFVSPTVVTPQVVKKMEKEEAGKWYMEEEEEEKKKIQKRREKLLSLLNSLNEAVENLQLRIQELEKKISQ